jgi:hypothetical protein
MNDYVISLTNKETLYITASGHYTEDGMLVLYTKSEDGEIVHDIATVASGQWTYITKTNKDK